MIYKLIDRSNLRPGLGDNVTTETAFVRNGVIVGGYFKNPEFPKLCEFCGAAWWRNLPNAHGCSVYKPSWAMSQIVAGIDTELEDGISLVVSDPDVPLNLYAGDLVRVTSPSGSFTEGHIIEAENAGTAQLPIWYLILVGSSGSLYEWHQDTDEGSLSVVCRALEVQGERIVSCCKFQDRWWVGLCASSDIIVIDTCAPEEAGLNYPTYCPHGLRGALEAFVAPSSEFLK